MENLTATQTLSWYRQGLFVTQNTPSVVREERDVIPTLDRRPSRTIRLTACACGAIRPIDRICLPRGDGYLLELLGLPQLANVKNRELAQRLREMP